MLRLKRLRKLWSSTDCRDKKASMTSAFWGTRAFPAAEGWSQQSRQSFFCRISSRGDTRPQSAGQQSA